MPSIYPSDVIHLKNQGKKQFEILSIDWYGKQVLVQPVTDGSKKVATWFHFNDILDIARIGGCRPK